MSDPTTNPDPPEPRREVVVDAQTVRVTLATRLERLALPLLAVAAVLDLLSAPVLFWLAFNTQDIARQAQRASSTAHVAQVAEYRACSTANTERAGNKRLWVWLIDQSYAAVVSLPADEQAREKSELQKITAEVNQTYAPLDCSKYEH